MQEMGIDISKQKPKSVELFLKQEFDYIITVCDQAKESCPNFPGEAKKIHWSFQDPAIASGDEDEKMKVFRKIREQIAEKIKGFIKNLKGVLIVEELEGFLEKEINVLAREANSKLQINGKNFLSEIGELNQTKVTFAIAHVAGKEYKLPKASINIPKRFPRFCPGCPHGFVFNAVKKAAPEGTILGGDIGCYMLAGMPEYDMQDYLFSMGSSIGIGHGIKKMTGQKVIAFIGDSTFFHAGIPALINTVFNKSNPLIIISDNRTTAMTGHQTNPGLGRTGMGEITPEIKIEDIVAACGVKNLKVIDPINKDELEKTIKEFLDKDEVSVIVARRICIIVAKRQKNG
jgi:indolepyruvate ferredoxin oxidoreductase alpha subunit